MAGQAGPAAHNMSGERRSYLSDQVFFPISCLTVGIICLSPWVLIGGAVKSGYDQDYLDVVEKLMAAWLAFYGSPAAVVIFRRRFYPRPGLNRTSHNNTDQDENAPAELGTP